MAHCLQHVDGTEDVNLEVAAGALDGGGHGDLTGEMEDDVRLERLDDGLDIEGVANVAVDELDGVLPGGREGAQPCEVCGGAVAGEVVEDGDLVGAVCVEQISGQVAPDKPAAARNQCVHLDSISRRAVFWNLRSLRSVVR